MPEIITKIYEDLDLTVQTVTGSPTVQDISDVLDRYYSGTVTKLILWDTTFADLSSWKSDEVISLARKVKSHSHLRKGGKTAMVLNRDVDYGITRMYQAYAEIEKIDFELQTFRDMNDAKQWLGIPFIPGDKPKDSAVRQSDENRE